MNLLLFPLGVFFLVQSPIVIEMENLREVRYYASAFYAEANPPFTLSPSQILPVEEITAERIERALVGRNLVIEVCQFERKGESWYAPSTLNDRRRLCETYGTVELEQRP